jgi:hypothetical protein
VFINGDADAYYRSVATLQSNQLRGMVGRSLEAYSGLFAQHEPRADVDPQVRLMGSPRKGRHTCIWRQVTFTIGLNGQRRLGV